MKLKNLTALLFAMLLSQFAMGQAAGSLDTTFDGDGMVVSQITGLADIAHAVAVQPDGKIVVGGSIEFDFNTTDFVVARYNADGSLDTSFGGQGFVRRRLPGTSGGWVYAVDPAKLAIYAFKRADGIKADEADPQR